MREISRASYEQILHILIYTLLLLKYNKIKHSKIYYILVF